MSGLFVSVRFFPMARIFFNRGSGMDSTEKRACFHSLGWHQSCASIQKFDLPKRFEIRVALTFLDIR
jgi:hypothetical protein